MKQGNWHHKLSIQANGRESFAAIMDSKAYRYFVSELLEKTPRAAEQLPVQLIQSDTGADPAAFKALSFFLERMVSDSTLALPSILTSGNNNFFSLLFRRMHATLACLFAEENTSPVPKTDKRNGTELLLLLCHAVTPKRATVFSDNDALSYAMTVFLIEAGMHVGWCPNTFETRAKRAAHCYFNLLKKSRYLMTDEMIPTVLGYSRGAWLCAQNTEGIQDHRLEWEHADLTYHYIWENRSEETPLRIYCTYYKKVQPPVAACVVHSPFAMPHLLSTVAAEGQVGMFLYSSEKPLVPKKQVTSKPIERPHCTGEYHEYMCETTAGQQVRWGVAIQLYMATMYRIDVLTAENGDCSLSHIDLRLENGIPLNRQSESVYIGISATHNFIVACIKNPFNLVYSTQDNGTSVFTATGAILRRKQSVEMITARAIGKGITAIDRTHLTGIF